MTKGQTKDAATKPRPELPTADELPKPTCRRPRSRPTSNSIWRYEIDEKVAALLCT